jgi:hypothetical protein
VKPNEERKFDDRHQHSPPQAVERLSAALRPADRCHCQRAHGHRRRRARRLGRRDIGTTVAFEYTVGALFVVFAVSVLALAARPSVRQTGIVVAAGNVVYMVASVVFVLADVFPLTTAGVVSTLAVGVYTLVMAELQYQGVRRIKR